MSKLDIIQKFYMPLAIGLVNIIAVSKVITKILTTNYNKNISRKKLIEI